MRAKLMVGCALALAVACSDGEVVPQRETTSTGPGGAGSGGTAGVGGEGAQAGAGQGGDEGAGGLEGGAGAGGDAGSGGDGGGGSSAAGFVSGARLRARYYEGSDGSKQFVGFFDSMLGVNCWAQLASDGSRRCLPQAGATAVFSDMGCTQPALGFATGCVAPALAYTSTSTPCGTVQFTITSVGALIGPAYLGTPANCNLFAAATAYTPGAVLPPTDFVEMTEMVE